MKRQLFFSVLFALVGLSGLTGCNMLDMPNKMDDMRDQMGGMSDKMGTVSDGIHLKELFDSFKDIIAERNTMVPDNPVAMVPDGKIFAEKATPEELAQIVEIVLQDINQNQPDDSSKVNGKVPDDLIARMEHDKIAKLAALQVITGFAQQSKIETMVNQQIRARGLYERAAYNALMLRALFIQGYRFGVELHDRGIQNIGEMREAISLTDQVEYIVQLEKPITDQIMLKTTMLQKNDSVEVHLDTRMTADMWTQIENDADNKVAARLTDASQKAEFRSLYQKVDKYVQYYKPKH